MHPLLDLRPWPRALLQYPLLILTAVLLGGALAFVYSYAPLHRAKDWEIAYLEERLQTRTEQVETLEAELRKAEATVQGQPSNDEVKSLRAQLDESQSLSASLQKQVGDLEQKLTQANRSRDSWKKKHGALVAEAQTRTRKAEVARAENDRLEADEVAGASANATLAAPPKVDPGRDDAFTPPAAPAPNLDPTEADTSAR